MGTNAPFALPPDLDLLERPDSRSEAERGSNIPRTEVKCFIIGGGDWMQLMEQIEQLNPRGRQEDDDPFMLILRAYEDLSEQGHNTYSLEVFITSISFLEAYDTGAVWEVRGTTRHGDLEFRAQYSAGQRTGRIVIAGPLEAAQPHKVPVSDLGKMVLDGIIVQDLI